MRMPFSRHKSTISCCGRAGWFSIWLTAGMTVQCGRSSSRYFLLYYTALTSVGPGEDGIKRKRGIAHVADANALYLARLKQLLHLLPRIDMVVRADDVALAVGELREAVIVAFVSSVLARLGRGQQNSTPTHHLGSSTTANAGLPVSPWPISS